MYKSSGLRRVGSQASTFTELLVVKLFSGASTLSELLAIASGACSANNFTVRDICSNRSLVTGIQAFSNSASKVRTRDLVGRAITAALVLGASNPVVRTP